MTQEELDALMAEDLSDLGNSINSIDSIGLEEPNQKEDADAVIQDGGHIVTHDNYRVSSTSAWPPPPPTDDHKVVHQLDDVTKDSEEKATEMFDKLETINGFCLDAEKTANNIKSSLARNIEVFDILHEKFPNVVTFSELLELNKNINSNLDDIINSVQMGQDEVMMTMDMMQYQDIHRQKIERVINVMRALSKYMNSLFEGKIDDDKRVGSAMHIEGDTTTEDVVSNADIEALIDSLGKK
ncbi:chemotaxis protein [Campylobacter vicugnae]|uniref:chemotaxis protein n=1 Tax=Campylobacter vicugnae TaxID=1660076 RepID=UPI00254F3357|nr:chemotaxis protein [Campylobacter ovis]MDL0094765.1 chemotaxis protein [Campylobacter ovis]